MLTRDAGDQVEPSAEDSGVFSKARAASCITEEMTASIRPSEAAGLSAGFHDFPDFMCGCI